MDIKLVVTDLDGTLLSPDKTVSDENIAAVKAAVKKGVTVTIATGRLYASALSYAEQLEVDVPIITYNGALIKSTSGEVWFKKPLDEEAAAEVLALSKERGWHIQSAIDDVLYYREHNEKTVAYERGAAITGNAVGDALYTRAKGILKLLLIMNSEAEADETAAYLTRRFAGRIFAVKSNPTFIEIVHHEVNKAAAMEALMEKLRVGREAVMAIGDSNNDLPMLKTAGLAVAMENANPSVKAAATCVTASNAASGVARAIEKYILNR